MCNIRTILLFCVLSSSCMAQQLPNDPDFAIQGEYVGPNRAMQVVAMGEGAFDVLVFASGLPGAGWNRTEPQSLQLDAEQVAELVNANRMTKTERKSPTLGLKPPADAVVLFDGTTNTLEQQWQSGAKITDDGLLQQGATTRQVFQDFTLHLEFLTPFVPQARGQARGNSGVYFQGRYEAQILDSFGLTGKMNEAGGLYSIRAPDVNMCFPPLTWQTYDVDFLAARYDDNGMKIADARATVRLNGVIVQQDIALPHATTAAPLKEGAQPGPIYLQDHRNPVRFRNIWLRPRDVAREVRRPIVAGYERLFSGTSNQRDMAGQLLLRELACANCHSTSNASLKAKQAPVLDTVGQRIRPDYLLKHLSDPRGAKQGTTMPNLLGRLAVSDRERSARAIASFLLTTGTAVERLGHPKLATRGLQTFLTVGCTACHASQQDDQPALASDIPLGPLEEKYTLDSLIQFLQNPHLVRPGGRMPAILQGQEATEVATYLLRDAIVGDSLVNVNAAYFRGNWDALPDFDSMEPYLETQVYGLDLGASGLDPLEQFAARFDFFVDVPKDGRYQFSLASDDGSRLTVDGEVAIEIDGVHPVQSGRKRVPLTQGRHSLRVEYFEKGGEQSLELEIEGGGIARTPIEILATIGGKSASAELKPPRFIGETDLVIEGRQMYSQLGCASCHILSIGDQAIVSQREYPSLEQLRVDQGCLAVSVPAGLPDYELTSDQRSDLQSALVKLRLGDTELTPLQSIHLTMSSLNCFACHRRDGIGGPPLSKDSVFRTNMQEMGDEGRLPPPLDGVGDKLADAYLKNTLEQGAHDRPYMSVRMPGFGKEEHVDTLADLLIQQDQQTGATIGSADEPPEQTIATGRLLAGGKGLSCVKCHTAGGKGSGIRALDLQQMASRLREDWFHRYLMNPAVYRPGTRMPASFPDGKSVLPEVYAGDPTLQINALWQYLRQGKDAKLPIGAEPQMIELLATDQPVLYRNFLSGLSPRGIGVGFPEGLNIAWDANTMALAQVWKGPYIDASRHWIGRGQGAQSPLGDQVLQLESAAPVTILDSIDSDWPVETARERGYRFRGYRLSPQGRPTFRYSIGGLTIDDATVPAQDPDYGQMLVRSILIQGSGENVVVNIARGREVRAEGEWLIIDGAYAIRAIGELERVVRDGIVSLRKRVDLASGADTVRYEIRW
ncbi:MAG: DUF1080 domain-containing protein [Planctomycetales bacterium]|nr:DUF1080 domain-containing protein [Planctomycetales bacterium]